MKAWWVNHKQTERQEADGQYIWSPQRERSGAHSQFYNNMTRASIGEPVISFARSKIHRIGRVAGEAVVARNPFRGTAANVWGGVGWFVPVRWMELNEAVNPRDFLAELAPLLPSKYSPIRSTGHGNQKAYLCEVSMELWSLIRGRAEVQTPALADWLRDPVEPIDGEQVTEEATDDETADDRTTRRQIIDARRGQGLFRSRVEVLEPRCRLTGVTSLPLLRASHIKPWRVCETAAEKLDGANGLMLSPDADHLFDRGWITFENNGAIRVSPQIAEEDLQRLGFQLDETTNVGTFSDEQAGYLEFHRTHVFKAVAKREAE